MTKIELERAIETGEKIAVVSAGSYAQGRVISIKRSKDAGKSIYYAHILLDKPFKNGKSEVDVTMSRVRTRERVLEGC